MRRILLLPCLIAILGFNPSLASARSFPAPPRHVLGGIPGGSASVRSDGGRYVAVATANRGAVVIDTQTGERRVLPASTCSPPTGASATAAGEYELIGLSAGVLVSRCTTADMMRTTSAGSLAALNEVTYTPTTATNAPPASAGSSWARFPSCAYGGSNSVSCDGEQLFSTMSGAVFPGTIKPSPTSFADLDAPSLMRPLCSPVRLANARLPGTGAYEQVEGVQGPWVLLRRVRDDQTEDLLAWHCGQARPRLLGQVSQRAQLGSGLVSWQEPNGSINVENLATGHRLRWLKQKRSAAEYPVVHTSTTMFTEVVDSGGRSVLTASLARLRARAGQPSPAAVAPPEGIVAQRP
jgi:hypothetical protein